MKRRTFIQMAGLSLPFSLALQGATAKNPSWDQTLILIELKGGNDGLNMVVPHAQSAYYDLRKDLALTEEELLVLNSEFALNAALEPIAKHWDEGQMAIILGLGYPDPNRSHFRSIDIWNTASNSNQYLSEGWISQVLGGQPLEEAWVEGLALGTNGLGPLAGPGFKALSMDHVESFLDEAQSLSFLPDQSDLTVLGHVLSAHNQIVNSYQELESHMQSPLIPTTEFPTTAIGSSFKELAALIANGLYIPVVKLAHGSYDTHTQQLRTQNGLLTELAEAIAAFSEAMREIGQWDRVAIQTYSEFGRRPEANASGGTDHGTAAPHFLIGGSVKGGLYGDQPSLSTLSNNGDMDFSVDFRTLYASLTRGLWALESSFQSEFGYLDLFGDQKS